MGRDARREPRLTDAANAIRAAWRLLRDRAVPLALGFACMALALWTFGELAEDVLEGEPFDFDEPLLRQAHAIARPELDAVFLLLSAVGFAWGVIPADILLTLVLAWRRRFADATFVAVATAGSGLLNFAAKHTFERERPALWTSIAPEPTYSFPSGHAMASATLACVVVLLARGRRYRPAVFALALAFTVGVGASRVYLGVHYPSDIVAGWAAAVAWTVFVYVLVRRRGMSKYARRLGRTSP